MSWKTGCRVEGPGQSGVQVQLGVLGSGFGSWNLGFACLGIGVQLGVQGSEFWKLEHGLKMIYA